MKKLMYYGAMFVVVLVLISCSSNSPSNALKKYTTALQEQNYEKFVEGINFSNANPEKAAREKEGFVSLMKEKGERTLKEKGGLKSVKMISEEIAEDGKTAVVKYKQVYGNGEETESIQKMVKVDGKWLMDISK